MLKGEGQLFSAEGLKKNREIYVTDKVKEIEDRFGKPLDEVIKDREKKLQLIAKMVGRDFKMNVAFGQPGGGSFFDPEETSITLDPLILMEADGIDEFVAGHEGAHRAITVSMGELKLEEWTDKEGVGYASKVGWGFIHNCLEDPAVNDWTAASYEKFGDIMKQNYDESFEKEGTIMSTPQIQKLIDMLGYVPNFVKFGAEVMRYWHTQKFSSELPESVEKALKKTRLMCKKFIETIPFAGEHDRGKVQKKAKSRWDIYEKGIWPRVQELIEEDKADETLKQYMKNKLEDMFNQESSDDQQGGQGQGQSLDDMMDMFGFDEKEKQEMREKIKEALERRKQKMKELKEQLENGEITQEEYDKKMEQMKGTLPVDMKSMSDSLKGKIKDAMDGDSEQAQQAAQQAAQDSLENAEDVANKDIEGKIGPKAESHAERRERQDQESADQAEEQAKLDQEQAEQEARDAEHEVWKAEQDAKRSDWEKAVSTEAPLIDELYDNIEELFKRTRHPQWQTGHSSGQRLDLTAAMQYEADPTQWQSIWERKTIPEKSDYRFLILTDQSYSMGVGDAELAKNALLGAAVVTEVLAALGIPCANMGFDSSDNKLNLREYQDFDEDLLDNREQLMPKLSKLAYDGRGGTPTYLATEKASEKLAQERKNTRNHAHFLLVVSDGELNDMPLEDLTALNKKIEEETGQVVIGIGIGSDIKEDYLRKAYGEGRYVYVQNPKEFPKEMGELLWDIFTQSQYHTPGSAISRVGKKRQAGRVGKRT